MNKTIINEKIIDDSLFENKPDRLKIRDVINKSMELQGLDVEDVAALSSIDDPELIEELYQSARFIKNEIYGKRLVLFAPLYISNLCANECSYCAFRAGNTSVIRRALTQEEIARETEFLIEEGHKRVLLVAGEAYPGEGFPYILKAIDTVYSIKKNNGHIRRINVNIAPLEVEEYKRLKEKGIGTYQLFQETYHFHTYQNVHLKGKKADYDNRINAIDRAMMAGIDDIGIGILFGLYDWRFEILALMQHIRHLESEFGVGPHTISVPRLEPASGSNLASSPPFPVGDSDFKKIVAILRLAVPYTGIIMSTRETPKMRSETFAMGVSQISAGSRTNPGGYSEGAESSEQFSLGDHRSLNEVIKDVMSLGYIPSFCTGCYRLGRTGEDFMDMAKPGLIKLHCQPNAILTLKEYLLDYGDEEAVKMGEKLIEAEMKEIPSDQRRMATVINIERLEKGERDLYF